MNLDEAVFFSQGLSQRRLMGVGCLEAALPVIGGTQFSIPFRAPAGTCSTGNPGVEGSNDCRSHSFRGDWNSCLTASQGILVFRIVPDIK